MPTYFDSKGNPYQINQPIGRGGEGTVYFCPEDLSIVAKIYHEPVDEEKAEKLRWMAANSDEKLVKVATWILDTLHEKPNGRVIGFLMPNVRAKEIHELYSLKSRRVHFPEATWQFLVHAATNVARAFHNLHGFEHVMGDVNHGNCVVLADGTVKLIDCDSYSIKTDKIRYRCDVGVATHLAPELQGIDLSEVERTPNHDNFGLAVIIFQLLFLGRHPFAGNYLGDEDKSLEDCIRERRFAYGANSKLKKVKQPPGTLSLAEITPRLGEMFESAFMTLDRPEPREWIEALEDLGKSLKQCSVHIGHYYFDGLASCPWCSIETKTGLMLFPFVSSGKQSEESFNVFTVERLLASLELPGDLPAMPTQSGALPMPSAAAASIRDGAFQRLAVVAAIQTSLVLFATFVFGAGVGFFLGAISMVVILIVVHNSDRTVRERLESDLYDAQLKWKEIEKDWGQKEGTAKIEHDISTIRQRLKEHQEVQSLARNRISRVSSEFFTYKLHRHLAGFTVRNTSIPEVSGDEAERVHASGVTTAADISEINLDKISNLGPAARRALLDWRAEVERRFEFDSEKDLPEKEKERFELEFTGRRRQIEREIERMLVSLRSSTALVQSRNGTLAKRAAETSKALLQAESDLAAIGTTTPLIVTLILITALIPMFGAAGQSVAPEPPKAIRQYQTVETRSSSIERTVEYQVPDGLTDKQIAGRSEETRRKSADALVEKAFRLIADDEFADAEKKLRYALRFDPKHEEAKIQLARVLFEQGLTDASKGLLAEIKSDRGDQEDVLVLKARILITERDFESALVEVERAVSKNPASSQALLYQGIALRGNRDYEGSIRSLSKAAELDPGDLTIRYELGLSCLEIGDRETATNIYWELRNLDSEAAAKLNEAISKKTGTGPKASGSR